MKQVNEVAVNKGTVLPFTKVQGERQNRPLVHPTSFTATSFTVTSECSL